MKKVIFIGLLFLNFSLKAQEQFSTDLSYSIDSVFNSSKFRELDSLELAHFFTSEKFTKDAVYFESEYFLENEKSNGILEIHSLYVIFKSIVFYNYYDVWLEIKTENNKTRYQIQIVLYNISNQKHLLKAHEK